MTKNNEKITNDDHDFLIDLLKHHKNADEKLQDLSYFTVSPHSEHSYSRCFYIVRNDGTKEVNFNKRRIFLLINVLKELPISTNNYLI